MKGYEAVSGKAGWRLLSERGVAQVAGPDHVVFLHNMISNDVEGLQPGQGRRGTLLTSTGKMVAEFDYYRRAEQILAIVSAGRTGNFITALEGYIIMDDVTLDDCRHLSVLAVQGPSTAAILAEALGLEAPSEGLLNETGWQGATVYVAGRSEVSHCGVEVILPAENTGEFCEALEDAGVEAVDADAWDLLRLERGRVLFGVDVDENSNPLEAGYDDAVSLQKGCYVGQEMIARATNIGGIPRRIVRVVVAGDEPPAPATRLVDPDSGRRLGAITSCRWSPGNESLIGLARVRSAAADPGTVLAIEDAGEPAPAEIRVVDRFPAEGRPETCPS